MTPPQLLTSKKQDWETPAKMFESLDAVFHFDIDIAASEQNSKTNCFIDEACNALIQSVNRGDLSLDELFNYEGYPDTPEHGALLRKYLRI